jgi:hypothetical protein
MRNTRVLFRYTFLALLVLPILIGYASTRRVIAAPPAVKIAPPVVKTMPTISWSLDTTIAKGTALAPVLTASGGVAGTFSYTAVPANGTSIAVTPDTVLPAGDYTITANFTPLDQTRYHLVTTTVPLTVRNRVRTELASR